MVSEPADRRPRAGIVFWETYLGCAPSLISAARAFSHHGWAVDFLMRSSDDRFVRPPDFGPHVRILYVDRPSGDSGHPAASRSTEDRDASSRSRRPADSVLRSVLRRVLPDSLRRGLGRTGACLTDRIHRLRPSHLFRLSRFVRGVRRAVEQNQYACLIGVDMYGLGTAFRAARPCNLPVLYWSLEIQFESDFSDRRSLAWKREEKQGHQNALALIIQDRERAEALIRENDAADCPVLLVPNSPRGIRGDRPPSRLLHDRLSLPPEKTIVLHAGSVCEGMRSHDLARAAADWPDDRILVFHSHTSLNRHDEYAQAVTALGDGHVVLSSVPVDYDDLDDLFASAAVGLVIYDSTLGPNFQLLAGASGKLAHYLRCGVPVVCIDNPSIGRVLSRWQCGVSVKEPAEVGTAVQTILDRYDEFHRNALKCFQEAYEFDRHFQKVLDVIEQQCSVQQEPGNA